MYTFGAPDKRRPVIVLGRQMTELCHALAIASGCD
jgi:hypothetical protein